MYTLVLLNEAFVMGVDRMETKELRQSNRNGARVGDIELVYIIMVMTRKES